MISSDDEPMSVARTIGPMVGVAMAMALVYVQWWSPATFGGTLWPPSEWQTGDIYRAGSLVVLAILGVVLYRLTSPLKGDLLERAQQRAARTKRIVLLLIVVALFLFFSIASPSYRGGLYAVFSTTHAHASGQ
jgi:membrane protease YdiL (CAAX protease family)